MDVKKKNKKSIILLMMMNIIIISPNCPPIYKSPCRVLIGLSMHKTMGLEPHGLAYNIHKTMVLCTHFCACFVWNFEHEKEIVLVVSQTSFIL